MPQYKAPGVYVEEERSTPPIVGVGTSTAGFIGEVGEELKDLMPFRPGRPEPGHPRHDDRYELAKPKEPKLITNWEQFKNTFGDFHAANSTLAHAVYGFFNNGGTACWITRVDALTTADVSAVLAQYEKYDEIAVVAAPGALDQAVQLAVIEHCENMKDRFAILDGKVLEATDNVTVETIKGTIRNSQYATAR